MSSNSIVTYLQIINTIATIILNLSPIFVFIPVLKGKQKYTNIPFLMLFFNLLGSTCWSCYWYRMSFFVPVICNIICWLIASTFFIIYLFLLTNKILPKFCLYIVILLISEIIIIVISLYVIKLPLFGIILIIINIFMFLAPGQNIIRVIKEKDYKLIPIASTIVGIICSGGWLLFGKIINDINCIIPNTIGLISSILTTFIWIFFYLRAKILKKRGKLYSEENTNNNYNVEIK